MIEIFRKKPLKMSAARLSIIFVAVTAAVLTYNLFAYPDIGYLKVKNPGNTPFMELRRRERIMAGKSYILDKRWAGLSDISPFLVDAVLIAEDDKFWKHDGFDIEGIEAAVRKNIRRGKLSAGGSTITQQVAKNLFLSPEKSASRKLREAIITWRLERTLGKKRILEIYLNIAEWGDGIFGAEAAAWNYFDKPAESLTPREAAQLAAVLPNPRKLHPVDSSPYVQSRVESIYKILLKRNKLAAALDTSTATDEPAEPSLTEWKADTTATPDNDERSDDGLSDDVGEDEAVMPDDLPMDLDEKNSISDETADYPSEPDISDKPEL